MPRASVCLLCCSIALAQAPAPHPEDSFDSTLQAYWTARSEGRFNDGIAKRDEARSLLDRVPVDPQFANRVQSLAQTYQNSGMHAQARALVQQGLSRAGQLNSARIQLLSTLADLCQQDRNLLKSLDYREKAVVAAEAMPPEQGSAPSGPYGRAAFGVAVMGRNVMSFNRSGYFADQSSLYQRLADLYQQLGRPEAVASTLTKMRALAKNHDATLASAYERQGQLEEAAEIYRKQAEQAVANPKAEPWQIANPLQSLASLYQREQRFDEAAAAIQQAISALDATGKPEAHAQTIWMRQNLAGMLAQAGQTQAADRIYQQLLTETQDNVQVLTGYANHLSATKRGTQAEELLNDYLARHSGLQPQEQVNILYALSNVARGSGESKRAEEYQRAAQDKQPGQVRPSGQVSISADLRKAQSAAAQGNIDEAFDLSLQALDVAPRAVDRDQVPSMVSSITNFLLNKKAEEKAEQLYQRLFAAAQSWSADNLQPLMETSQNYSRFLMQQKSRWAEVPGTIDRFRSMVVTAHGEGTGALEEVLRLTMDFERIRGAQNRVLDAAQDLLALEESLSGTTSEPYLRAVETLADASEPLDPGRTLALRRQAVAIADLALPKSDARRGYTRINAAFALARQRQFDEAERLANEAVAIAQGLRPPQPTMFTSQLEQIQRMKAAQSESAAPNGPWFNRQIPAGSPGITMSVISGEFPAAAPPPKPATLKQN